MQTRLQNWVCLRSCVKNTMTRHTILRPRLSISPSLWNARAFLGMCRLHLEAAAEGRNLIEESLPYITDNNLHVRAGLDLVNSYTDSGMIEKAEPILKQLEQLDPSNAEVLYVGVSCSLGDGIRSASQIDSQR